MAIQDHEQRTQHPSFGTISIARSTGQLPCNGSMLEVCSASIHIKVSLAELVRHTTTLDERWWHVGPPIVDFRMSPHQFAEAITSMNGVEIPITISAMGGHRVEDPPRETPFQRMVDDARSSATEVVGAGDLEADIRELLAHVDSLDKLPKRTRLDLADRIKKLRGHVSVPSAAQAWAKQRIMESTQQAVSQAKAEIAAAFTSIACRLGLRKLADMDPGSVALELQAGDEED